MAKTGRPPLYEKREDLEKAVKSYFKDNDRPTVTGLTYHLGMTKETFSQYQKKKEFSDLLRQAKLFIESKYEERAVYENSGGNLKFTLAYHFGWVDVQHVKSDNTNTNTNINITRTTKKD